MDIHNFVTQERIKRGILEFFKIDGMVNPAYAMPNVLYRILFSQHFDRQEGYNRSQHATHPVFHPNPNNNITEG
jgi:hypothetical protein